MIYEIDSTVKMILFFRQKTDLFVILSVTPYIGLLHLLQ